MFLKRSIIVTLLLSISYVFDVYAQIQTSTISKSYCTMSSQSSLEYPKGGYMILTTNEVKNNSTQFNAFVSHKQSKGFNVTVYTEDQYGSGKTGNDAADNIQKWLKINAFGQTYLLIIANPDILSNSPIPMRTIDAYHQYPSDFYYADYTSTWDYNKNGVIGNFSGDYNATYDGTNDLMDGISELQVGRIPYFAPKITDLDKILSKIITYEDETDIAWRKKCLLPMKPVYKLDDSYRIGEWIKTNVLIPKGWGYYRIYDSINAYNDNLPIQGVIDLNPQPDKKFCNYPNVLEVWQNNTIFPFKIGLVHWSSHGSWLRATDVFYATDAVLLDNLHPAIVFMEACGNSSMESPDQSVGYLLLLNGAIATVGATSDSWGSYKTNSNGSFVEYVFGFSQIMSQDFAQYVVTEGMEIGRALSLLRFHDLDRFYNGTAQDVQSWENRVGFNIYGCPDATLGFPKPSKAPSHLLGKSVSPTSIMLSWVDNSDDETAWCLERRESGQQTWEFLG